MKERGIRWYATVTTVAEALEAEAAGADVIVAQGAEAGGHRGAFNAEDAASKAIGLFSLLPAVVDAGATASRRHRGHRRRTRRGGRTCFWAHRRSRSARPFCALRKLPSRPAWADAIGSARPEGTITTRAFSGRLGRSIRTAYADAASGPDAPDPAPYPVQRGLTGPMRAEGTKANDIDRLQAWAGQSAGLARAEPAGEIVTRLWAEAQSLLGP